jgi:hypothetical protein
MSNEPIGQEISIAITDGLSKLADLKPNDKCTLTLTGVKLGQHQHSVGKENSLMVDIKIEGIEYDDEEIDEEDDPQDDEDEE